MVLHAFALHWVKGGANNMNTLVILKIMNELTMMYVVRGGIVRTYSGGTKTRQKL